MPMPLPVPDGERRVAMTLFAVLCAVGCAVSYSWWARIAATVLICVVAVGLLVLVARGRTPRRRVERRLAAAEPLESRRLAALADEPLATLDRRSRRVS